MDDKYYFGNKLYDLRTEKGLTQKELGKILGVSNKAVSKWETGEAKPRLDTVNKLSALLSVSVSELLGEEIEATENIADRQLENYSNYFSEQSKKLDSRFKLTKALIVIAFLSFSVLGFADALLETMKGNAASFAVCAIELVVLLPLLLLSLSFITKIYNSNKTEKNQKVSKLFFFSALFLIFSSVESFIDYHVEYGADLFFYRDYKELLMIGIWLIVLLIFGYIYKTNHKDTTKLSSVFYCNIFIVLFLFFGFLNLIPSLILTAILLFAVRAACKQFEWNELAQKVDEGYSSSQIQKAGKKQYVIICIVSAVLILTVSLLTLLTPFIMYKFYFSKLPDQLKQPVPEYQNYELSFDGEDIQTIQINEITFSCPSDWNVEVSESENYYDNSVNHTAKYKNDKTGVFLYVNDESHNRSLRGIRPQDDEFDSLGEETKADILEKEQTRIKADKLYRKYFNIGYDMTLYQGDYLRYSADLRDVKWYQIEKLVTYTSVLIMKDFVADSLVYRTEHFQNKEYCGYISYFRNEQSDKKSYIITVYSGDGTNDDRVYQLMLRFDNLSEQESVELMSKILNSVEFAN